MYHQGFLKVASAVPVVTLGDPLQNVKQILSILTIMEQKKVSCVLLPELAITGYSAGDLFFQKYLLEASDEAVAYLLKHNPYQGVVIFGSVFNYQEVLYNCAIVMQKDKMLGIIPKIHLPQTKEFYEARWFASGEEIVKKVTKVSYLGQEVPFGNIIFTNQEHKINFGAEVCADIWAPVSPHIELYANDAHIVFNPSASDEYIGKNETRRMLLQATTYKWNGAYVYVSTGASESSSEVVFSGHKIIAERGKIVSDDDSLTLHNELLFGDLDMDAIKNDRRNNGWFKLSKDQIRKTSHNKYQTVFFDLPFTGGFIFEKKFDTSPFVTHATPRLEKAIQIQSVALQKRLSHIGIDKVVIGVSGGLDSTLALLSTYVAFTDAGISPKNIIGVTMPSSNTSSRTLQNARLLMKALGVTIKEISIHDQVVEGLAKIEHSNQKDVTYENAHARYRTMILMNLANQEQAICLGTGDMSEVALGWSTFNGDHMAMYGLNAGIPKTVIVKMVEHFANRLPNLKQVLLDIVNTPISPELSSQDQLTEAIIGTYQINDFIMYRFLVTGDTPNRIDYLLQTQVGLSKEDASLYVKRFIQRFYQNQYKRATSPEAVKIVPLSLSPRTELRIVGDINYINE